MIQLITRLLIVLFFSITLFADERIYQRKSITSPSFVWISKKQFRSGEFLPDPVSLGIHLEKKLLLRRFDHNVLSDSVLIPLRDALETTERLNSNDIAHLFEGYLVTDILTLLNDASIQKERSDSIKKEKRRVTLAETKGKLNSLSEKELAILMNSAYIYFPYITEIDESVSQRAEKARVKVSIRGGILWYRVTSDGHGQKGIEQIAHIRTRGSGSTLIYMPEIEPPIYDKKNEKSNHSKTYYQKLSLEEIRKVDFRESFNNAFNMWILNLTVKMKNINDFRLRSPIKEAQGSSYLVDLNSHDGIRTDDSFYLMHYIEENGVEKQKKVGYGRLIHVASKSGTYSEFDQVLGTSQVSGGWVEEHAKTGIGIEFLWGPLRHVVLDSNGFEIMIPLETNPNLTHSKRLLSSDATSGTSYRFRLTQNLAPYTGITQFFFFLDTGFSRLHATNTSDTIGTPTLFNVFSGLSKKFWFRSRSIGIHTGLGLNQLHYNGKTQGSDFDFSLQTVSLSTGLRLEQQISPHWSGFFQLNLNSKVGPQSASVKINNETVSPSTFERAQHDINGLEYLFGFKYDLKSFHLNLNNFITFWSFL